MGVTLTSVDQIARRGVPCIPFVTRSDVAITPDRAHAVVVDGTAVGFFRGLTTVLELGTSVVQGFVVRCNPAENAFCLSPRSLAVAPSGDRFYLANRFSVSLFELASEAFSETMIELERIPRSMAIQALSEDAAYLTDSEGLSIIDITRNNISGSITLSGGGDRIAFTPDGKRAYVSVFESNSIAIVDTTRAEVTGFVVVSEVPTGIEIAEVSNGCPVPPGPTFTAITAFTARPTRTPTGTRPPTQTHTPRPTTTPVPCVGDCNDNGQVTVDELIRTVKIVLGQQPVESCSDADADHDGTVDIDDLVRAVRAALFSCTGLS